MSDCPGCADPHSDGRCCRCGEPEHAEAKADFEVRGEGPMTTVYILLPLTDAGRDWADEHLPEDAPTFGGGYAVEHRYIQDIVEGIRSDGLAVR